MTSSTNSNQGTLKSYIIGFILSVVFTLTAFFLVEKHILSGHTVFSHQFLLISILTLAILQMLIQLIFFLHLGNGRGARWNLVMFATTVSIILILVIGSIWIMNHLNYNMTPEEINNYMNDQGGGV